MDALWGVVLGLAVIGVSKLVAYARGIRESVLPENLADCGEHD